MRSTVKFLVRAARPTHLLASVATPILILPTIFIFSPQITRVLQVVHKVITQILFLNALLVAQPALLVSQLHITAQVVTQLQRIQL